VLTRNFWRKASHPCGNNSFIFSPCLQAIPKYVC